MCAPVFGGWGWSWCLPQLLSALRLGLTNMADPWALGPTNHQSSALGLQTSSAAVLGIESIPTHRAISQTQNWLILVNRLHVQTISTFLPSALPHTPKATYTKCFKMQSGWHKALHSEEIPLSKLLDDKLRCFNILLLIRTEAKTLQSSGERLQAAILQEKDNIILFCFYNIFPCQPWIWH